MGCRPDSDLISCCVSNNYRKCAVMAAIGIINSCDHYDDYGCGIYGIVSYANAKGYKAQVLWSKKCSGYGVVEVGEKLPVFYSKKFDARMHAEAAKFACRLLDVAPAEIAAAITYFALKNRVFDEEWARLAEEAIRKTLRAAGEEKLKTGYERLNEIYGGGDRKKEAAKLLDVEGMVKKYIIVGRRNAAANLMANMLAVLLPSMSAEMLRKYVNALDILGAALTVLHAAAITLLVPETLRSPEEVEEAIAALDGTDSNIVLVVKFAKKYLEAVKQLEAYYAGGDKGAQYVKLHGASAFVKIGGAGGHHARVTARGSKLVIEYSDHDSRRIDALAGFLRKIGVEVSLGDGLTAEIPAEKVEDVAVVLATLPSVDIQNCYHIYEDADSVEELVELRKRCGDC